MHKKPKVCVVDENSRVELGWVRSLGTHAQLSFFRDHLQLNGRIAAEPEFLSDFHCIVLGKMYPHLGVDIVETNVVDKIRATTKAPIFLNWQGYVAREDLDGKFDGKIFHRYGVKWHTLRLRIQRLTQRKEVSVRPMSLTQPRKQLRQLSRDQRCQQLLAHMAAKAKGRHRDRIEFYMHHDHRTGIELLEALYNRLITQKERPISCPSQYINSSPVIAARILQETLASH